MLNDFQRYAAKRIQRFNRRALNATSIACLGWINIIRLIQVKKLLFLRTILILDENNPIRRVLVQKVEECRDADFPMNNAYDSPITDLLNVCYEYGVLDQVCKFAQGEMIGKGAWKRIVWEAAWQMEVGEWERSLQNSDKLRLLGMVMDGPAYSVWWQLADVDRSLIKACELMVKLLCKGSNLKGDDIRLRGTTVFSRMCCLCDVGIIEDAVHVIMQCPAQADVRQELCDQINSICPRIEHEDYFHVIMGKFIQGWEFNDMVPIWSASCQQVMRMYNRVTKRVGVG